MTQRIYYSEPYRRSFDGKILAVETVAGHTHVTLDQTAFYPTSGGQPFDTGTLGGAAVTDVIDREDGTIAHVVSGSPRIGEVVTGEIDWARRFDHMQQHTGQHVLSAAFDRLCGVRTESFHMGQLHPTTQTTRGEGPGLHPTTQTTRGGGPGLHPTTQTTRGGGPGLHPTTQTTRGGGPGLSSTIDLAREVSESEIARVEDDANRIVWEDRPVTIRFASAEEAAAMPLRKESARTGPLRLIDVQDYDLSACGGTHVERTGAIGMIAIAGWEKFKGGSRVEFLCGGRALQRFRVWRSALSAVQKHLSVPPIEMAASIERMQDDAKAVQRTVRGFQEKLAAHEGQALAARMQRVGGTLLIAEALEGWDPQGLKAIALAATAAQPEAVVALFTSSTPAQVVIARGPKSNIDAGALLKRLAEKFGGKGGGKPDLAQGGGLGAAAGELIAYVKEIM